MRRLSRTICVLTGELLFAEDSTTYYSLLPTPYSPLTTHYSLLTTHHSLLPTPYSLLTTHYPLLTNYYPLLSIHSACYFHITMHTTCYLPLTHHPCYMLKSRDIRLVHLERQPQSLIQRRKALPPLFPTPYQRASRNYVVASGRRSRMNLLYVAIT